MKPITRHKGGSARWRRPLWLIVGLLCALAELAHAAAVSEELPADIAQLSDSLRRLYAPDQREELFQLDFTTAGRKVMLRGVTTSAPAKRALLDGLRERGYEVMDALSLLPDERTVGRKCYGIVNVSVCNLRTAADFSSEMASQALMGMPVRLLQDEGWFRVQTPDSYIGWVHHVGIHPVTAAELTVWNRAEKLVVVAPYGTVYSQTDERSQPVSDCVAGNRLKLLGQKKGFYHVAYPDGREGYLRRAAARPERAWREALKQDERSILQTAKRLMGVPYLWAGTSSKGVDCSGFVREVLFEHDILIPRDASQQACTGQRLDIDPDFGNLRPGDLIFFGRTATAERPERVVHVALYLGDKRFIHSQGDVHISSFDPADPLFDAYNLGRLLFAARVLPFIDKQPGLTTTRSNPMYQL